MQLALDRTSPPLDYSPHRSPYSSQTIQPPHPFHHQEPPRMELSTWNRLTAHGLLRPLRLLFTYNPLKHLSIITYCVCSVPVYTLDIKAIQLNVSILILNINRYRYLASTFPTSPTALPCSTSLYQVSPTMPCILLVISSLLNNNVCMWQLASFPSSLHFEDAPPITSHLPTSSALPFMTHQSLKWDDADCCYNKWL